MEAMLSTKAIYVFLDNAGGVLYIGQAKNNVKQRVYSHNHLPKKCYKETFIVEGFYVSDLYDLDYMEQVMIYLFAPLYNKNFINKFKNLSNVDKRYIHYIKNVAWGKIKKPHHATKEQAIYSRMLFYDREDVIGLNEDISFDNLFDKIMKINPFKRELYSTLEISKILGCSKRFIENICLSEYQPVDTILDLRTATKRRNLYSINQLRDISNRYFGKNILE